MSASRVVRRIFMGVWFVAAAGFAGAALAVPKIEHWTLANGARVYFVEAQELPMLQVSVVFDAGSMRDVPATSGLSLLTAGMLSEGAGDLDENQIAERFEALGAEFGSSSNREMATVSLRCLSQEKLREPALDLLSTILRAPTFPAANLERERRRALIGLQQIKQAPDEIAAKTVMELLYPDHPYGLYPRGSETGLKAITREHLTAFYRQYYVGSNAIVAIVGDLGTGEAKRIAEKLVGALPAGKRAPALPPSPPLARATERVIDYPSAQSHVLIAAPGMARSDPDYFPLLVGNHVLGGSGLVSRLSQEVREKQGLSYSVYSYFNPLKERGPFVMGLQTKNAQRERAVKVLRASLADFLASGPTEAELAAAKKNLTGGFPLRIDSNNKIADYLAVIGYYDLPLDYLNRFIERVDAVDVAQVRAAFARHLDPQRTLTVIVGGNGR